MLSAVPLGTVSSLTGPQDPVTAQAITVLDEARRWFLQFGWEFNREYDIELKPDSISSEITLPANYTSVVYRDKHRLSKQVIQRGNRMYDATGHTYSFSSPIHVDVLVDLPLEEFPESAKEAVAADAALRLKRRVAPDPVVLQALAADAQQAFTNARIAEQRAGKFNVLDDPLMSRIIERPQYRRGPFL